MAEIAYPSGARTTQLTRRLAYPQAVLESAYSHARQTLIQGYPRWVGTCRIDAEDEAARIALHNWLAAMARGDNWTNIPIGTQPLKKNGQPSTNKIGNWVSDGKRVYTLISTAPTYAPDIPTPGGAVTAATSIPAYQVLEGEAVGAAQTFTPDFMSPITFSWVERVVP